MDEQEQPFFCHRCGKQLRSGEGNFYVVKIESYADPAPPNFEQETIPTDISAEIDELLHEMRDMTEQDLMDQVYRRLTIHLCGRCYRKWIENPAGDE